MNTNKETYSLLPDTAYYLPIYWNPVTFLNASPLYPTNTEYEGGMGIFLSTNFEAIQPIKSHNSQLRINPNDEDQKNLLIKPLSNSIDKVCYNSKNKTNEDINQNLTILPQKKENKHSKIHRFSQEIGSSLDLNQIGKTNWTSDQEEKLKQMVNLFGKRWKYISQHFPSRTGKQIRERYLNYLRPNLSLKKWTQEEDQQILKLVSKYGRSWRNIEKKLKNRSQNQIKNRYYGHLQKNQKITEPLQNQQNLQNLRKLEHKTKTQFAIQPNSSNEVQD